jgi:hypothetical protein
MCGNTPTDYYPCPKLTTGPYKLETTAYVNGETLGVYSISFEIVNIAIPVATTMPVLLPVQVPYSVPSKAPSATSTCQVPKVSTVR